MRRASMVQGTCNSLVLMLCCSHQIRAQNQCILEHSQFVQVGLIHARVIATRQTTDSEHHAVTAQGRSVVSHKTVLIVMIAGPTARSSNLLLIALDQADVTISNINAA